MERIKDGFPSIIDKAFLYIPDYIRREVYVHFFCGTDPFYAGIESGNDDTGDGRSFRNTAHIAPACCQLALPKSARHPTIVLPDNASVFEPRCVLHEYGHAIENALYSYYELTPITDYASTDDAEAFAEAFVFWALKGDIFQYYNVPDNDTKEYMWSLIYGEYDDLFSNVFKRSELYC